MRDDAHDPGPEFGPGSPGLRELVCALLEHHPRDDVSLVAKAYHVAQQAHDGQVRASGDPYFSHPLEVATTIAQVHMDADTVAAALLHDVLEDTEITKAHLVAEFSPRIAEMVEGVTKLRRDSLPVGTARQQAAAETRRAAESLRKMLLAVARDPRVMVIKLADRLHNLQTIEALEPPKRTRIASETLDVYAPLAARLGVWQLKWQLEDLAFKVLHPSEFREVSELVAKSRAEREGEIRIAIEILAAELRKQGLQDVEINGRPKHLYSIFNKMVRQNVPFEEIYDLIALRVITSEVKDCYLALGIVHTLWRPMGSLFVDHIAMPKPNGYQSLHTKVLGPSRETIEVQIRTRHMHEIAEFGVAAHYEYKDGEKDPSASRFSDLGKQLLDISSDHSTSTDFLRNVSEALFGEQVFVFTPKGDVIDLPKGSCPIDVAFRVHTDIGLTLVGAKVNGLHCPLTRELVNRDVVELFTRSNASPSPDWLQYVKSPNARSKLRNYFNKQNRAENIARGKETLERELRALGLDPRHYLGEAKLDELAQELKNCDSAEDLLAQVGEGNRKVQSVLNKMRGFVQEKVDDPLPARRGAEVAPTVLGSLKDLAITRARCCSPLPGDEVLAYVSRGRGMILHRRVCPNVLELREREAGRITPYQWNPDGNVYAAQISIVCMNRQGLLMDISTIIAEAKASVVSAKIDTLPNHTAEIRAAIEVTDVGHLHDILAKIGALSDVISVLRGFAKTTGR